MKINYEEIMLRAAKRAADLRDFTEYTLHAKQMADELLYAAQYFVNIRHRMKQLDPEARDLLGDAAARADEVGKTLENLIMMLTAEKKAPAESKTWSSLAKLVEELK